jgi:valine--pyruvate aminotransferase
MITPDLYSFFLGSTKGKPLKLSSFGEKFASESGIVGLMDDLGNALRENPSMIMMGGGNPGRLPAMEAVFQRRLDAVMRDEQQRHRLFGRYQSPQGDHDFRACVAEFLSARCGSQLDAGNIAISNGSQPAFFTLFNMLAGETEGGGRRSIHLPLTPEYLGYADCGLTEGFFTATRPEIELLGDHLFKYRVDFRRLELDGGTAALCVSLRQSGPATNHRRRTAHLDASRATRHSADHRRRLRRLSRTSCSPTAALERQHHPR